jgi:hypothetical protein
MAVFSSREIFDVFFAISCLRPQHRDSGFEVLPGMPPAQPFVLIKIDWASDFTFHFLSDRIAFAGMLVAGSPVSISWLLSSAILLARLNRRFDRTFFCCQADRKLLLPSRGNVRWFLARLRRFFSQGSLTLLMKFSGGEIVQTTAIFSLAQRRNSRLVQI